MTSTPMVETIARALCRASCDRIQQGDECDRYGCKMWHLDALEDARAALSALSTPNEGMVKAGAYVDGAGADEVWTAMIQSALNEGKA